MKLDRHRGMSPGEIAREAMAHIVTGRAHLECAAQDLAAIGHVTLAAGLRELLDDVDALTRVGVEVASKIVSRTAEELPDAGAPVIPSPPDEHGT